ncbi:MAG: copper homeostasis protein CutC [Chitinophagaceae bacterium]
MRKLEVCCYSIESCLVAQHNGAHRIELCAGPAEGGVTPSSGVIRRALQLCNIPVYPIIRPRGGDFLYSEEEFNVLLQDVDEARRLGCKGIVTGILTPDGEVDTARMKAVKAISGDMEITFHRAIDVCADPFEAIKALIALGVERVLSSGQASTAPAGAELLKELQLFFGKHIIIMPGAGIRSSNLEQLTLFTGAREFHSSAAFLKQSAMQFRGSRISMSNAGNDEFQWPEANPEEVHKMSTLLRALL